MLNRPLEVRVYIKSEVNSDSVFTVLYLLAAVVGYLSSLASDTASLAYLGWERLSQTGSERASWKLSESHIL